MLKILFAGTPEVAVPSLRALAADTEHFEIVAVLTRPDAPTGRGRRLMPSPVKQAAQELDLPVIESDPSEEDCFVSQLAATGAQAAAVAAYGKILRQSVLDALPLGWYNLHFSMLPKWRGAAPVQRAIWAGDASTGVSVFRITLAMDEGPIIAQCATDIDKHENAGDLLNRLAVSGASVFVRALQALDEGRAAAVEQQHGDYPIADKIRVEDAHIRFGVPVADVDRQIRACTPNPGAWCLLHAEGDGDDAVEPTTLHVLRAQPADADGPNVPANPGAGRFVVGKKNVWVGTASGVLELLEVKAQGKKAMCAADWARGARLAESAYCD